MTIRIGIIGSGFAVHHSRAIASVAGAKVVAVCSRSEVKARAIATGKGVAYYPFENYPEMLKKEKLDAVYICVPPFLLGELELVCADYVKALFIEKPVTLDVQQGQTILQRLNQAGTLTCVGYMNRYRANVQAAKTYFSEQTPILINASWSDQLPPPYWWRQRDMSGGQLTEQCTHFIDLIRYVAGDITEVSAYAAKGFIDDVNDFNVDDAVVMNFRLKSGAVGNVMTSCFTKAHGGGALGIYVNMASRDKTYRLEGSSLDLTVQHGDNKVDRVPSQENAILEENRAFIKAIQMNDPSLIHSSYADALETAKVSLAAGLSVEEKRTVLISEL